MRLYHYGEDGGTLDFVQVLSTDLDEYRCYFGQEMDGNVNEYVTCIVSVNQNLSHTIKKTFFSSKKNFFSQNEKPGVNTLLALDLKESDCGDCGMSYLKGEYDVEVCVGGGGGGSSGGGGSGGGRCCLARALGDEGADGGDTLSYTSDEDLRTCRNFQLGDVEASDISMTFTFSPSNGESSL